MSLQTTNKNANKRRSESHCIHFKGDAWVRLQRLAMKDNRSNSGMIAELIDREYERLGLNNFEVIGHPK